jgi:histidine ammonia-lyase
MAPLSIVLDGGPLALEAVLAVARDGAGVELAPAARRRIAASREFIDRLGTDGAPVYGVTTGVGKLKDTVIPAAERARLQRNLVVSHAGGVGAALAEDEVRAVLLLLAASLGRAASGVRPEVVDLVVACLNRRVHPVVPELGSLGSSGDLARAAGWRAGRRWRARGWRR